jgi:predicted amidophosphoribosyltransferase
VAIEELSSLVRAGASLVLPRDCAGCGRPDRVLCRRCAGRFGPPVRCEQLAAQLDGSAGRLLPTWALASYGGAARHAILAWKSGGRQDLAAPLTGALEQAAAALGPDLGAAAATAAILVVPAPSGPRRRRHGEFVVGQLADAVGSGLAGTTGRSVVVVDPLRRHASTSHLLGAAARQRDRSRAVHCLATLPPDTACLLVDDVVTTGSTLAACARALREAGGTVIGAMALAVTPPPGAGAGGLSAICQ